MKKEIKFLVKIPVGDSYKYISNDNLEFTGKISIQTSPTSPDTNILVEVVHLHTTKQWKSKNRKPENFFERVLINFLNIKLKELYKDEVIEKKVHWINIDDINININTIYDCKNIDEKKEILEKVTSVRKKIDIITQNLIP